MNKELYIVWSYFKLDKITSNIYKYHPLNTFPNTEKGYFICINNNFEITDNFEMFRNIEQAILHVLNIINTEDSNINQFRIDRMTFEEAYEERKKQIEYLKYKNEKIN